MTTAFDSDPIFETNPRQLSNLVSRISGSELALPDFQRRFVWDSRAVVELIRSIISRYPVGSLLFWRQPNSGTQFASKPFDNGPSAPKPNELVLDGQQRLTSLYRALTGKGPDIYYLRLRAFLNEDFTCVLDVTEVVFEEAIFSRSKAAKIDTEADLNDSIIPIWNIPKFHQWLDDYVEERYPNSPARRKEVKQLLWDVHEKYLVPLKSYGFPVVTLPETTSLDAVCTIFESLNKTGQRLEVFDLLTARFYPAGINLRQYWEDAKKTYPVLKTFKVDPYKVMQAVSLQGGKRSSAQRSDVLNLSAGAIEDYWKTTIKGFVRVLTMLQDECGVASAQWLPYSMILVPMAAVWAKIDALKPIDQANPKAALERYFWCSVFSGNFDQGANSQAGADYAKLKSWIIDPAAEPPEAIQNFSLNASALRFATIKRKALYNGMLCLCVEVKAQDFHTGQTMTPARVEQIEIESHHIFPRAYLDSVSGHKSSADAILNRALIDKDTNRIIRSRAPKDYIGEMEETYGPEKLTTVMGSHLIRYDAGSPLAMNDYERFLDERLEALVDQIELATGKVVTKDYDAAVPNQEKVLEMEAESSDLVPEESEEYTT